VLKVPQDGGVPASSAVLIALFAARKEQAAFQSRNRAQRWAGLNQIIGPAAQTPSRSDRRGAEAKGCRANRNP